MRSSLQILLIANLALFALRDLALAWFAQRTGTHPVQVHAKPLILPSNPNGEAIQAAGNRRLLTLWHLATIARTVCAVLFVYVFIAVFAQVRWPYYWAIVKSQFPQLY